MRRQRLLMPKGVRSSANPPETKNVNSPSAERAPSATIRRHAAILERGERSPRRPYILARRHPRNLRSPQVRRADDYRYFEPDPTSRQRVGLSVCAPNCPEPRQNAAAEYRRGEGLL